MEENVIEKSKEDIDESFPNNGQSNGFIKPEDSANYKQLRNRSEVRLKKVKAAKNIKALVESDGRAEFSAEQLDVGQDANITVVGAKSDEIKYSDNKINSHLHHNRSAMFNVKNGSTFSVGTMILNMNVYLDNIENAQQRIVQQQKGDDRQNNNNKDRSVEPHLVSHLAELCRIGIAIDALEKFSINMPKPLSDVEQSEIKKSRDRAQSLLQRYDQLTSVLVNGQNISRLSSINDKQLRTLLQPRHSETICGDDEVGLIIKEIEQELLVHRLLCQDLRINTKGLNHLTDYIHNSRHALIIREIDLSGNDLLFKDERGCVALIKLIVSCPNLQSLNISECQLTFQQAKKISLCVAASNIIRFNLGQNPLIDQRGSSDVPKKYGIEAICDLFELMESPIIDLRLANVGMGRKSYDRFLEFVKSNPTMISFCIDDNDQINDKMKKRVLKQCLKNIKNMGVMVEKKPSVFPLVVRKK